MLFSTFTAGAVLVAVAAAAPTLTYPGPPVVYQIDASAPLVTATTLAAPASTTGGAQRRRRDDNICQPQPKGISYKLVADTANAFVAEKYFSKVAKAAKVPMGFASVFSDTKASPNAPGYLGFTLMDTYDVNTCANKCNAIKDCTSFNVYYERDPSVNPNDASCSNPPSSTNIKCVWWSSAISPEVNINNGQKQNDFQVVIAGSNGYVGLPFQRGFRLRTANSGTKMDGRWLAVSPGEGAAVALNPVEYKPQTSIFQFAADGSIVQIAPKQNMGAYATKNDGTWAYMRFRSLGQRKEYIKCTGDDKISCHIRTGVLTAGVCINDKSRNSGLLYLGLASKIKEGCKPIELFIDTDVSDVTT